ncbi:tetratricopeptide repeat protein [Streptomyces sp. NPDC031705]|uniref:tetratricopeptide repeat protein n=1 Tax=Streptomyces sp. NPDC031705 TaxID=3155729 RepID=UPI0033F4C80D
MLQHLITQDENLRMVPTDRDMLAAAAAGLREELRSPATDADRRRVLTRWTGIASIALGDYPSARAFLRQALDLATASGGTRAVIATQLNLGDAYRYAGEAQTADTLYRNALDTARARQPDLLDFALQHYAKHLMEGGDLDAARSHLLEALRLRQAKGDAELIQSTQAAVDRVEVLLDQADAGACTPVPKESSRWSSRWTSWLQARTSTHAPDRWSVDFPAVRDAVHTLAQHERGHPQRLRDQFPVELVSAMAEEAEKSLAAAGYLHNGKWNAAVGDAANHFANEADLAAVVARHTGLEVEQPHTGVYIAYLDQGQFLDFHLDEVGFGEANLILCLTHERATTAPTGSCTIFITPEGYRACDLAPGDGVVFDGSFTPHGRTPLGAGESVTLVSFGFRARDRALRTLTSLPPVPQ